MDKYVRLLLASILLFPQGTLSQYRYNDDFQAQTKYDSDYPDIVDYDDTRPATHLDGFIINEQFTRDTDDPDDGTYVAEDGFRSESYKDRPLNKVHSKSRNTQDYKDSISFLSPQNKRYGNLDLNDESSVGPLHKLSQEPNNRNDASRSSKPVVRHEKHNIAQKDDKTNLQQQNGHESTERESNHMKDSRKLSLSVKEIQNEAGPLRKEISTSNSVNTLSSSPVVSSVVPQPRQVSSRKNNRELDDAFFAVVVAACSVAGVAGLVLAGYCWYRLRKESKDVTEGEVVGFSGNSGEKLKANYGGNNGDEKLTTSAEMYHYLHAKKHLTAMDAGKDTSKKRLHIHDASDTSDEESDNTVYECPGLAPPGDMKVVNPLFSDAESRHSDRHSDHHSDAKSEGSASSSPPYRPGRSSMSSASSKP